MAKFTDEEVRELQVRMLQLQAKRPACGKKEGCCHLNASHHHCGDCDAVIYHEQPRAYWFNTPSPTLRGTGDTWTTTLLSDSTHANGPLTQAFNNHAAQNGATNLLRMIGSDNTAPASPPLNHDCKVAG